MTYIEKNFFRFPIKMYDLYSVLNADITEDKESEQNDGFITPTHVDWAESIKVCKPETIIGWVEGGHRGQNVQELVEDGFPITIVSVEDRFGISNYECTWPRDVFEKKLNARMSELI